MKIIFTFLLTLFFPFFSLSGLELPFQEYSLNIDVPETISVRYYTPDEEDVIYVNSKYKLVIRIQNLDSYLHDEYSHTYLSKPLFSLVSSQKTVSQENLTKLLSLEGSSFILNKPSARYDIDSTYKKYALKGESIGESYFGMIGDGGLAPSGYHSLLLLLYREYIISISFVFHDLDFSMAQRHSEYFYKNRSGTFFFNEPSSESIKGYYNNLMEKDELDGLFNYWNNLVRSIKLDGQHIYRQESEKVFGVLNDTYVRIRQEPNLDGVKVGYLHKDQCVQILDQTEEKMQIGDMLSIWYKVRTEDGTEGWAYGYFVDIED